MRNRVSSSLVMLSVVLLVVAGFCGDAFASATAKARCRSTFARAVAQVKNGPYDEHTDQGGWWSTSEATAYSNNPNGSWAYAYARAKHCRRVWTTGSSHIMPRDWGSWGLAEGEFADSIVIEHDIACSTYTIGGPPDEAVICTYGNMRLFPRWVADATWSHFELTATDETGATRFWGKISLVPTGVFAEGDYDTTAFDVTILGDTIFATIDHHYPLVYAGSIDSLEVEAVMHGKATEIPTLTEWGLIIFGVVLLGFITWVFLKRRKAIGVRI